jgi:pimeloyl-ACP methyl ester carboxylesterase
VERQVLFNTPLPDLRDLYAAAGVPPDPLRGMRPTADYYLRQGTDAEGLIAELDTPERRRSYIADFYGHRLWAAPGGFTRDDVAFMTEPFADRDKLRASWGAYESAMRTRRASGPGRFREVSAVPTLVLYGPDDHVIGDNFREKAAVAFSEIVGPFTVQHAGHFLQWEQATLLNRTLSYFLADLRQQHAAR